MLAERLLQGVWVDIYNDDTSECELSLPHLDVVIAVQEEIEGFDVAVDDLLAVHVR